MRSNRWKFITAALAIAILGAGAALAEVGHRGHWGGPDAFGVRGLRFMSRYLNLTEDQQAQMKQIMQKEKPAFQPLMQQLKQVRAQERQIAEASTFDENQARTLATQQAQTMADLTVQKLRVESEMYQVLTSDQKTKLNQFLDQRGQRAGHRMRHQQSPDQQSPSSQPQNDAQPQN